jgi:hypothetical protein
VGLGAEEQKEWKAGDNVLFCVNHEMDFWKQAVVTAKRHDGTYNLKHRASKYSIKMERGVLGVDIKKSFN